MEKLGDEEEQGLSILQAFVDQNDAEQQGPAQKVEAPAEVAPKRAIFIEKKPEAPVADGELAGLQAFAARRRRSAAIGQAGSEFTQAFMTPAARTSSNFWDKWGAEGDHAVNDYKARKTANEENAKKAKAAALEAAMNDLNSPETKFAREAVARVAPSIDTSNMSAATIEKFAKWATTGAPKTASPLDDKLKQAQIDALGRKGQVDPLETEKTQAEIDRINADAARLRRPPTAKPDTSAAKAAAALTKDVSGLRKEANALPEVKSFKEVQVALEKVKRAAAAPSPAGDLSLIYAYNKLLDPGSAVKEGEFKNAALAGSFGDKIQAQVQKLATGTMLTADQRADFVNQSKNLYQAHESEYRGAAERYRKLATKAGGDADDVIGLPGDASETVMVVPPGSSTPVPVHKSKLDAALKAGGKVVDG